MQDAHDLEILLRSSTPIVVIESREEPRLLQLITQTAIRLERPMFSWSLTAGLVKAEFGIESVPGTESPEDVLRQIAAMGQGGLFALLDFHPFLNDPFIVRAIKDIAQGYDSVPRKLIFISHAFQPPAEISHLVSRFDVSLPNQATIHQLVRRQAWEYKTNNPNSQFRVDRTALDQLIRNLAGVTHSDAERLIRNAIEQDGAITHSDVETVMTAKHALLNNDGVISFEYATEQFGHVAGLSKLKDWLEKRQPAFRSSEASDSDRPRGIMMVGVQGAGKSLAAKACAGMFQVPLLRLDFAVLYNKYIGETERNLRSALKTAEAMAPCVLWIDEIEKGLSDGGDSDSGTARRTLGTMLTWMAENEKPVFIAATSNDIEGLPPELIRKGRLDEIFFVDLPDGETRAEIFRIHLRKRDQQMETLDFRQLAAASRGFSGAEIEQAVVSAIYHVQAGNQPLSQAALLAEIDRTMPLSVTMAEKISYLRDWAQGRTVAAH